MNVHFAYLGRSAVLDRPGPGGGQTLQLAPNLTRDPVAFDAPLLKPLRFREAMSALHDTVVSDLRYVKKDKTAYREWKKGEQGRQTALRAGTLRQATAEILARQKIPVEPDFLTTYEKARRKYWHARQEYSSYLIKHDHDLWRKLMPCDPVITVADDVIFFECFSADESSYGCLTVNRGDGFGPSDSVKFGTTNVDYSWDLYNTFQSLRTYRETRFRVDPAGFEVATQGAADYREEKIDLPDGWLRGFMQIQSAMGMPAGRVTLSREAVYSILAWHKRHKAYKSPRALRFELLEGKPPRVVLEPWETSIVSHGTTYRGPSVEPIRVWGARRLMVLERVLPLAERFDVYLLGTGLPSFWVAHMGEMRLTVGLSGWTTNDWTRTSAIDMLAPPADPAPQVIESVAALVRQSGAVTLSTVEKSLLLDAATAQSALRELAHAGQVIYDLAAGVYRWRQVMPQAIGQSQIGPDHPELVAARQIMYANRATLESRQPMPGGDGTLLAGKADNAAVEILVDSDQRIRRGKCACSYYHKFALKNGPCRHMLALRWRASVGALEGYRAAGWYNRLFGQDQSSSKN